MNITASPEDWREIVCCGLENQQIDFKSHQNWETIGRVGRAKFARHAMALGNTLGGYVVVGVSEDQNGNPTDYVGMTEEEAASFDPSTVGQTINNFADPPVSLDIVRPVVDGKRYVVMVVYPFTDMPHVCSENCERELQRGAFYVRTPDARSKVACQSSELHQLIRRALRNQRQMLGRMLRGILYEDNKQMPESRELAVIPPLIDRSRQQATAKLGKKIIHSTPYFEVLCTPTPLFDEISLTDVRKAIDSLERPTIQDFLYRVPTLKTDIFATNDSICGVQTQNGTPIVFWEFYRNGFFYIAASLPDVTKEKRVILAKNLRQATVQTLALIGQCYSNLNQSDKLLNIAIRIPNSENAMLALQKDKENPDHVCRIMDIEVKRERTAADLESGAAPETATRLYVELCERFNVTYDNADIAKIQNNMADFISFSRKN